jgi:hypothetical protein
MPKTLYLSPRELATVVDALTLYAAEPDQLPPTVRSKRSDADRANAAILAGYAQRVALDTDTYDADSLRDQWYSHLRPDLTNPPTEIKATPCKPTSLL